MILRVIESDYEIEVDMKTKKNPRKLTWNPENHGFQDLLKGPIFSFHVKTSGVRCNIARRLTFQMFFLGRLVYCHMCDQV